MKLLLQNALFLNSVTMYFVIFGLYAGFPVSIYWTWNGFSNSVMNWINMKDEPENFRENHSLPLFHVPASQQGSCSSCSCTHPKEHDCKHVKKLLDIVFYLYIEKKNTLIGVKINICINPPSSLMPSLLISSKSSVPHVKTRLNLSKLWKQSFNTSPVLWSSVFSRFQETYWTKNIEPGQR